MLSDLGLPFRAGLDDIISLVPIWGDIVSGIMQLYQVWLAWLFGVPIDVCVRMVSCVFVCYSSSPYSLLPPPLLLLTSASSPLPPSLPPSCLPLSPSPSASQLAFRALRALRALCALRTPHRSLQIVNVLLDTAVGVIPFIGDILDNLWKANLRNLALLEDWLLSARPPADSYHILLMPDTNVYLPEPKKAGRWNAWFGPTGKREAEDELDRERVSGVVRRTRRMNRDEGEYAFGAKVRAGNGTESSTSAPDVAPEPLD